MGIQLNLTAPEVGPFIEWFRRQGLRVFQTESTYWYCHAPYALQAIPWHLTISPSEDELRRLLSRNRMLAARYSSSSDAPLGALSYHVVFSGPSYDISTVKASIRTHVKAGLRACTVKQIPLERYASESWKLQADTMSRHGQPSRVAERVWRLACQSAVDLPGFESWGAEVDGNLGAALLFCTIGDTVLMIYQQCLREYLKLKINNALIFEVTRALVSRPGIRNIHYGLHSLDAPPDIDRFKFRMGYQPLRLRQRVVFAPILSPLVGRLTHRLILALHQALPSNSRLAKAEGMVRFYLQGLRPAEDQSWPEAVSEYDVKPVASAVS